MRADIERAILTTLCIDNERIIDVPMLSPDSFTEFHEDAQKIFTALNKGNPATVGMMPYAKMPYDYKPSDLVKMALMISEDAYKRDIKKLVGELYLKLDETEDPIEALQKFDLDRTELDKTARIVSIEKMSDFTLDTAKMIEEAQSAHGLTGINTGLSDLNTYTGGWQKTDLIIVASRPGMGKTSLAIQYALAAEEDGANVAIYSMEMGKAQLQMKMVSKLTGISGEKMRQGRLTKSEQGEVLKTLESLHTRNIWIDDTTSDSEQVINSARFLNHKVELDLIVVDYLQRMNAPLRFSPGNQSVEYMSKSMKGLAMPGGCNCPVILLSQLSRAVETRGNKRPLLSDLRDSGAIEQDADLVQFIYREGYYDLDMGGSEAEIIIAKNRHGRLGTIQTTWIPERTAFQETDGFREPPVKIEQDEIPF